MSRLLQHFGDQKLHSLEEGLSIMMQWVKQHGARQSQKFGNIEVMKNFPKAWLMQCWMRRMYNGKTGSVICPAYNEEKYIRAAIEGPGKQL